MENVSDKNNDSFSGERVKESRGGEPDREPGVKKIEDNLSGPEGFNGTITQPEPSEPEKFESTSAREKE